MTVWREGKMSEDCIEGGVDVWRLYRGMEDVWRLYRGRGRCLETV